MKKSLLFICLLGLWISGWLVMISCHSHHPNEPEPTPEISLPTVTDDGWEVASLNNVGMDAVKLGQLLRRLEQIGEHRIHSILVIKNGKLVFEKYYAGLKFNLGQYTGGTGYDLNDLHVLCSATKSFTSALFGIAMDQGFIQSVEQKVFDFFPEHTDLLLQAPAKSKLSIKHLLTMTSGLTYDDESLPYTDPRNDMHRFYVSSDPIRFLLALPLYAEPGTIFDYANCNTNILGEIIARTVAERLDVFAKENLFDKLGIQQHQWQAVKNNVILSSGDLHLRPRDMAKFGLLFLNRGKWNGESIISSEWCDRSTAVFLNPNHYNSEFQLADGYGFQWWQKNYFYQAKTWHSYFAWGWGGQTIIMLPELNLMVVTTAGNWYDPEPISPFTMVADYIIPSVK
ncbi:serine hydrolase [candidate division KSB1 bacterium]|nr:serine hydrolase [candidate division KSB1 bacterium]